MFEHKEATYTVRDSTDGQGTFFFTDCGHKMYSVKDRLAYHGMLCPACFLNNTYTTLYIRGSEEADRLLRNQER